MIIKALAQGICNPALPWLPCEKGQEGGGSVVGNIISSLLGLFLILAGILSLFYLLLGGFQWITSSGEKAGLEAARNKIIHAIMGLILVASTWAIITLVLGKFLGLSFPNIKLPRLGGRETSVCTIGIHCPSSCPGQCVGTPPDNCHCIGAPPED